MGRAPNPGGPQRVSAHVVPKAKPSPDNIEDRTTLDPQWEEEASTTVEEGDVAARIRGMVQQPPRTNETGTAIEEPTVDDQNAQMSSITPVRDIARIVITQGNDAGQETEVRPGKTYSVGRAIENDIVLTDIAVSRKHFDLMFDNGSWLIADRGSGNGTVVNGNLEDNPYILANGDAIEIGNTVFRFDQPNGPPRSESFDDVDAEEEMSTVAGKPLRADMLEDKPAPRPSRPKTLPPPLPLRPAQSSPPPVLQPASTLPMPQMANRPPISGPAMPTLLAEPGGPLPLPTTIPGQGAPGPRPLYTYPQVNEIPPHSVHAQMLMLQSQSRRDIAAGSPYDGNPMRRFVAPQLTKRAKIVLAAIGVAVILGVATIAIVKSGSKPKPAAKPAIEEAKPKPSHPTATPIVTATDPPPPPKTDPPKATPAKTDPESPPPKITPVATAPTTPPPKPVAAVPPPRVEPAKPKAETRPEKKRDRREARVAVATPPKDPPAKSEPAAKKSGDTAGAESKAEALYKQKKFNDAASLLTAAAAKADEDKSKELRRLATLYQSFGRDYNNGMAAGSSATDAFEKLKRAQQTDKNLGNAFDGEIQGKLQQVAPKAAATYMASKRYADARTALAYAKQFGTNESIKLVEQKLDSVASELYNEAAREIDSNPTEAKEKLRQIKQIVDGKSVWSQKADKLLKGG